MKINSGNQTWRLGIAAACGLLMVGATFVQALEKAGKPVSSAPSAEETPTNGAVGTASAVVSNEMSVVKADKTPPRSEHGLGRHRDAVVVFGKNVELKNGETAEAVVVLGGSARVLGKVTDAVVVIGGDVEVEGEVGDAVVAVLGNARVGAGSRIGGEVVAVAGKVEVADGATVDGEVVAVGGKADLAAGATVKGGVQQVDFSALGTPKLDWLKKWFVQCALKGRPLAPQVPWVWAVTGVFFLLYLLILLAFPGAVQACLNQVNARPATTFLSGLLTRVLLPFASGLLLITGIGIFALPFLFLAALVAKLIGKAALLVYLGRQLMRSFKSDNPPNLVLSFVLGWVLVTLLYLVPFLGIFSMLVLSTWAIGTAVMALVARSRHEAPPSLNGTAATVAPPPGPTPATAPPVQGFVATGPAVGTGAVPPAAAASNLALGVPPVVLPEALSMPKAGFWERMAAGFLDLVLVGIASGLLHWGPSFLLVSVAYFAGMWSWRGTSIGGIVLNLRVVRLDGQPISFAVALVRALGAWFSTIILFLGFLWIAWDKDRQGWHDRIAGTVVVRQPRGTPLFSL